MTTTAKISRKGWGCISYGPVIFIASSEKNKSRKNSVFHVDMQMVLIFAQMCS